MCTASGVSATAASERGGGVNRQPATAARMITRDRRFERDGPDQRSRRRYVRRERRRETKPVERCKSEQAADQRQLGRQDQPVFGLHQRPETLKLDDCKDKPGQHQQATTSTAIRENRVKAGSSMGFGSIAIAINGAKAPTPISDGDPHAEIRSGGSAIAGEAGRSVPQLPRAKTRLPQAPTP